MCCDFAAGEQRQPGYQCWEKQLPPIRDAASTRPSTRRGTTDRLAAHPEVTRAKKRLQPGCPTATALPCASPQIHLPLGPLQAGDSGVAPALHPAAGGTPGGLRFPGSTVPGGTSTKTARSGPSPPGAVSSGRGRELSAVSINSSCPKRPCARGAAGWAGGARVVPPAGMEETRCCGESSQGSTCFSQTGLLVSQILLRKKKNPENNPGWLSPLSCSGRCEVSQSWVCRGMGTLGGCAGN